MNELAKWVWIILLGVLGLGWWFFGIMGIGLLAYLLISWIKPEWSNNNYSLMTKEEKKKCKQLPRNQRSSYINDVTWNRRKYYF